MINIDQIAYQICIEILTLQQIDKSFVGIMHLQMFVSLNFKQH